MAVAKKTKKSKVEAVEEIKIQPIETKVIVLRLVGVTELIMHKFSDRSIREMESKKEGKRTVTTKKKKDPQQDYEDSIYYDEDGNYAFPTSGFKKAAITACTSTNKAMTKVMARQSHHILNKWAVIKGEPRMGSDMTRINGKIADMRYRAYFDKWSTELTIEYNCSVIGQDELVNLYNLAGFAVGVGDWRVECNGRCGKFRVA